MNSTQQQIYIVQQILDGALLECYWAFVSFVLLSFLNHIRTMRLKPKTRYNLVPLSNVQYDVQLAKEVLEDITAQARKTYEANIKTDAILNNRGYTPEIVAEMYSIRELKAIARQGKVSKYSNMTKAQLAVTLLNHNLIY